MVWGSIYETFVISASCPAGQYDRVTGKPCADPGCPPGRCNSGTGGTGGTGPTAPGSCTDPLIVSTISSQSAFDSWNSGISAQINAATTTGTVKGLQDQIASYENCLNSKILNLQTSSTTISSRQSSVKSIAQQIADAKNDVSIAKDRIMSVKHPERISSYYESWFPMYRPLKPNTVPLLIGLSLFMFLLAILLLFSFVGISFNLFVPAFGGQGTGSAYGTPFMIVSGLAILFFALMIYAFVGR